MLAPSLALWRAIVNTTVSIMPVESQEVVAVSCPLVKVDQVVGTTASRAAHRCSVVSELPVLPGNQSRSSDGRSSLDS